MKLILALTAVAALVSAQPFLAIPREMTNLSMLVGTWEIQPASTFSTGWAEFGFAPDYASMTCRIRGSQARSFWREAMHIRIEQGVVSADFTDSALHTTHYTLTTSKPDLLQFESVPEREGGPVRRITYRRNRASGQIEYKFESGGDEIDSGFLIGKARTLPLSE
jgi:hypothetical protein